MLTLLISESKPELKCLFNNLTTLLIDSSKSHTPESQIIYKIFFFFGELINYQQACEKSKQ